jgi:serine/threonine-protein kinase
VRFLAMELVDGESLAERLASSRSGLPVADAVAIATQIGDALQAAHDKGIIHRDLKPANIMLTGDDRVKVLDFGLAKMLDEDRLESASNAAMSPTLSLHATYAGVILGTAAYMSPEQARGKPADKRTDVWAFGCVLYEMLTARRAFEGEDATDTIAAVVRGEPNWGAMPTGLPADVVALLKGCLQKDRRQRFPDIAVPLYLLREGRETVVPAAQAPAVRPPLWRRAFPVVATAALASLLSGAAILLWHRQRAETPPLVTRFTLRLDEGQRFTNPGRSMVAISTDGSQIAYVANERLYLRRLSEFNAVVIPGTESLGGGVTNPAFSPDGRSIVFWAQGVIKRIPVAGGTAIPICEATNPLGLNWYGDALVFAQYPGGILRVSAKGGKPETLIGARTGEAFHNPQLLAGGENVLFTVAPGVTPDWDNADVVVQSLSSGDRKTVLTGVTDGRYLPTGHLVYASGGILYAMRFDPKRLSVTGEAQSVVAGVQRGPIRATVHWTVSSTGTLIYVPGPAMDSLGQNDVATIDRDGRGRLLKLPPAPYESPRVSPDGTRLAIATDDRKQPAIWIYELSGKSALRQLTFGGRNRAPVWSRDGLRVTFQSDREGAPAIFWQPADGTGPAERLTTPSKDTAHFPQSWSADGKHLLFTEVKGGRVSLWTLSLPDKQATPFAGIEDTAVTAAFSPDGRWVAYQAANDTFVQPFPATQAKYGLVTSGIHPFWSADGKELFVVPRARLLAFRVTTEPSFTFSDAVDVPRGALVVRGSATQRNIDIMRDGKSFVGIVDANATDALIGVVPLIHVVEHWFDELKSKTSPQ